MSRAQQQIAGRLQHILDAIGNIRADLGDIAEPGFLEDGKTQRAIIESIIVIGEAASALTKLAPGLEQQSPKIWQQLRDAGDMRNVLAHEYFRVDPSVIWSTVSQHIWALEFDVRVLASQFPMGAEN